MRTFIVWLLLTTTALAQEPGVYRIFGDEGGSIPYYIERWKRIYEAGDKIIVDGPCYSACTLVLLYVPPDRICVTKRAKFGFHMSFNQREDGGATYNRKESETILRLYPPRIRTWISRRGGGGLMRQPQYLQGAELEAIYPLCKKTPP